MQKAALLVVLFIAVAAVTGCGSGSASSGSDVAEPQSVVSDESASSKLSADGKGVSLSSTADHEGASSSTGSLLLAAEWPTNEVTDGLPVPDFGVAPDSVDVSSYGSVSVSYKNVEESRVAEYIEQVKAAGFNNNVREDRTTTSYSFDAYNVATEDVVQNDLKTKAISIDYKVPSTVAVVPPSAKSNASSSSGTDASNGNYVYISVRAA